ncbi:PIN domain-containing protein [Asticcacaulis sp. YBE204]|uniref:PIN domain-containing protein n=1 Tax=Asticcacaulis sp. YBE204 TaxID=1282363 RepID=UPI0003C3C230|nr:PIN domain-containing protein [Asticcacaulis sp. YBE204]ESQ78665.1 hypothetical protein AEYBE204_11820 [Asticcacaulis sp. YBE204]
MPKIQYIITNFRDAANAINLKRNIKIRAKLGQLLQVADYRNDVITANTAKDITSVEILERADEIYEALSTEMTDHIPSLKEGDLLTIRDVYQLTLRDSIGFVRNELYRYYEPFHRQGNLDDGHVASILADGVMRAETAASTDASQRLKRVFRKAGLDLEPLASPVPLPPQDGPQMSVFVDTNLFLQYRDLKDLPWHDVLPGVTWLEIIVAKVVVEELDNHKNSSVRRRRDRARAALKRINEAPRTANGALELRAKNPKLTLRFVSGAKQAAKFEGLDLSNNDDRLVASFIEGLARGPCKLMSDDSGPRLTAYDMGHIHDVIEPLVEWRLKEEPDIEAQKLNELTFQLNQLKSERPIIEVEHPTEINWLVPELAPLAPEFAADLALNVIRDNPQAYLPSKRNEAQGFKGLINNGFFQTDIDAYNASYETYRSRVRGFFDDAHTAAATYLNTITFPIRLFNNSPHTAHKLLLELSVDNGVSFLKDKAEAKRYRGSLDLPQPPERPTSPYEGDRFDFTARGPALSLANLHRNSPPRDPTRFYWQVKPSFGHKTASLICEEFRANERVPQQFLITFFGTTAREFNVSIKITATNLLAPVRSQTTVRVGSESTSWSDPRVEKHLPNSFYSMICPER